jgi:rRNA maturation endonuclease Nob1
MEEHTFLCSKCRNIFSSLAQTGYLFNREAVLCPKCGSLDVTEAPVWAPLGSGLNIFDSSTWEYECQQCLNKFKMPIPPSPTEEKARICPACGAGHIHRLTATGGEPLYCG